MDAYILNHLPRSLSDTGSILKTSRPRRYQVRLGARKRVITFGASRLADARAGGEGLRK